jgi:hypothetical protein
MIAVNLVKSNVFHYSNQHAEHTDPYRPFMITFVILSKPGEVKAVMAVSIQSFGWDVLLKTKSLISGNTKN